MELKELKESKRQEMVSNYESSDYYTVNLIACAHNVARALEAGDTSRAIRKIESLASAHNMLIDVLNREEE